MLSKSQTAGHIFADDNLDNDFHATDCKVEAIKAQPINEFAVSLLTLEFQNKQESDQFSLVIMAMSLSDFIRSFFFCDSRLLLLQYLSIPHLKPIFIPHRLWERPYKKTHNLKIAWYSGVTQMHANYLQTYPWLQLASEILSSFLDCVHCTKKKEILCTNKLALCF